MDKALYIKYLKNTSKKVFPIILKEVNDLISKEPELGKFLSYFYSERDDKLLLKPTLFRLSYELCGGDDFEKYIPLAASFEVLNISSYQANASFDNKLGILNKVDKDNQFIASMLSRELANKLINKLDDDSIDKTKVQLLFDCISKSNLFIYMAQHYDLNLLSVPNANSIQNLCKWEMYKKEKTVFMQDYHLRCYFGSGVFSGQTALAGAIAANANTDMQRALQSFGEIYGTALHKINDLADFFPGEERHNKVYQDDFCDMRNNRLTLPIYELLTRYKKEYNTIKSLLNKNTSLSETDIATINNILTKTDIIDSIQKTARNAFIEAKKCLNIFGMSDSKGMLITLLSILESNKFYYRAKDGK